MHDARARLCRFRVRTFRRRLDQRLDQLMPETHDFVLTHIAPDHPIRQPRLKRLIDDAPFGAKICLAVCHELRERDDLRHAAPPRFPSADRSNTISRGRLALNLPNALASITAILLENAWSVR